MSLLSVTNKRVRIYHLIRTSSQFCGKELNGHGIYDIAWLMNIDERVRGSWCMGIINRV